MYPSKQHLSFGVFVKNQAEALRKSGIDVLVAANDNPATGKKNTILKYGKWAMQTLSTAFRHRKSISVTHAHYVFPSGVFSLLLKKLFHIPYIVTAHGGDIERMAKKNTRIHNWTELILQESEHIIAVGPVLAQQIEKDFHIPKEKITVCSMGVNRDVFKRGDKQAVRAELGLEQDAFTYLFVGNVIKQKGNNCDIKKEAATIGEYSGWHYTYKIIDSDGKVTHYAENYYFTAGTMIYSVNYACMNGIGYDESFSFASYVSTNFIYVD